MALVATARAQDFNAEDLAATIAFDSGYPEEGYEDYARSLARTLNLLTQSQSTKVLKGKRPLKKAEVAAAKAARDAARQAPAKGKGAAKGAP